MDTSVDLSSLSISLLLCCGILAALLKVGADVFAGRMWKGYSFSARSISELSAAGAPTRPLALSLDLLFDALVIAFSAGLWLLAGENLLLRIAAGLIAGNALINAFVEVFLPMRMNPDGTASAATIHVVLMAIGVLLFLLAMGLGGAAYRDWFRYFSFGILLAYVVLTVVRFLIPSPSVAGQPVPTVGVQERTMVVGYLLWVVGLAVQNLINPGG